MTCPADGISLSPGYYHLPRSQLLALSDQRDDKLKQFFVLSDLRVVPNGSGVPGEHCVLENLAGTVTLTPREGALCSVNGSVLNGPRQLTRGKNF